MAFYLDANVIVATLVPERDSDAIRGFLSQADEPLLVSEYTAAEVASAVSRLVRMGKMTTDVGLLALADFDEWRMAESESAEIENQDIAEAAHLVRRFELKLRAPDALHLAVTLRIDAKLVTLDGLLAGAAAACGARAIRPAAEPS